MTSLVHPWLSRHGPVLYKIVDTDSSQRERERPASVPARHGQAHQAVSCPVPTMRGGVQGPIHSEQLHSPVSAISCMLTYSNYSWIPLTFARSPVKLGSFSQMFLIYTSDCS